MSALAQHSVAENQQGDLTNISVNARVDYILRFSKQAIFVVGEESLDYSSVTSHFLANLNTSHNAAFIAVTAQLNDIQIRSRIIEQLFSNVLFDPELSIAVSIINLLKQQPQKISIALEHGQNLSLQILHELTQLAEVAKKSKLTIDVLISGDMFLGQKLAENTILFKSKTSVLSANSGQLIPLSSSLFKRKNPLLNFRVSNKSVIFLLSIILLTSLAIFGISKIDTYLNTQVIPQTNTELTLTEVNTIEKPVFVITKQVAVQANHQDIMNALISPPQKDDVKSYASTMDILTALNGVEVLESDNVNSNQTVESTKNLNKKLNSQSNLSSLYRHSVLYDQVDNGFVIQYAAFSDPKVKESFLVKYSQLEFISYFRLIDNVRFEVLTSKPYAERKEAEQALIQLPEEVKALNVWLKGVVVIKSEIKHYQDSQS